jgi:4-aminobutyrate aminotransferase
MMPGVYHAPYPDVYRPPFGTASPSAACLAFIEERLFLELVAPEEVAAIIIEPIQGEGGYIVAPDEFLQGLRAMTQKYGILLVADEVQSGMGRTGRMFAADHVGLEADVVTIAKGIASGMPLGVTCSRADIMTWPPGAHASTFGGNPVSCAAANATIELLKGGLIANAADVGAYLMDGLRDLQQEHALIGDVRGLGLMIGVELVRDRQTKVRAVEERNALVQAMFRRGVLVLGAGRNALRLAPPLLLTRAQADSVLEAMGASLREIAADRTRPASV